MKGPSLNLKNLHLKNINWFALVGGVLTLVLAVASVFVPWWQLTIGQTIARIGLSPVNMPTNIMGYSVAIPIIETINWIFMATFVACGIVLAVYSIFPTKPYSKRLLTFAYKKPFEILIAFIVLMLLLTNLGMIIGTMAQRSTGQSVGDLNVPWVGAKNLQLPSAVGQSMAGSIAVSTGFGWTFWLAVIVAALCLGAGIYHKKLDKQTTVGNINRASQETAQPVQT